MSKDTHKKIALITISLAGGGAEKSTALLSKMLDHKGFEVHIIVLNDAIDFSYAGKLYNMGIFKKKGDSILKKVKRFTALRKYIKKEDFDFIIDNRSRDNTIKERFYLYYIYKNQQVIYVSRSFKLDNYFTNDSKIGQQMIQKSSGVIGVSQAISKEINQKYNTQKAVTIYNPVEFIDVSSVMEIDVPYFIFVGRLLDKVKNVSLLINAFAKAKKENHHLKIYGDGIDKERLMILSKTLGMDNKILFYPFKEDIYQDIAAAKALLLTSHYEGFPRVLIEALSMGTPVISVDCQSGPNEVITHKENGLLVKNYDQVVFTEAIESFIFDTDLYTTCKQNAVKSVSHLKTDIIASQWSDYLNKI